MSLYFTTKPAWMKCSCAKIKYLPERLGKFYPFNLITEQVMGFIAPLLILRRVERERALQKITEIGPGGRR